MVDRNLFSYNLAVVAIFKDEAPYLREWLDYHLLAGAEHFYLYNNDSSDDYEKILQPYVEANLVTLIDWSGKLMQMPAYNDALNRYKFFCRYMAFIDLDEFIFPKTNQSIVEVVDEILSRNPNVAGVGINWQIFGSNGHETADYSRDVLERFTRRATNEWIFVKEDGFKGGNIFIKSVVNPRLVDYYFSPHYAIYFSDFKAINSDGAETYSAGSFPIVTDKLVVNHYFTKSKEEFVSRRLGSTTACWATNPYTMEIFDTNDRNEVFDDGILKYRAARAENFFVESDADKIRRVEKFLVDTLTQQSPFNAPAEFFAGKLETFLTCRKLAEVFKTQIGNKSAEEYALVWIYQTLNTDGALTYADLQLFVDELPEILSRPFPVAKKIVQVFSEKVLPAMAESAKISRPWKELKDIKYLQRMLNLILR
ncbi:MAG: glycosyltransferase family 92 protein [Selenomonadaceae bacterium]|nr:glycosyltransferase family 92 protein [Selenomonadaceae bacterium]